MSPAYERPSELLIHPQWWANAPGSARRQQRWIERLRELGFDKQIAEGEIA